MLYFSTISTPDTLYPSEGYNFHEAPNGVILCDGKGSDGLLPVKYFTSVIDVKDGANLLEGCRWSLVEWLRGVSKLILPLAGALMRHQVRPSPSRHVTQ